MHKDFDTWNSEKKLVDKKVVNRDLFFHQREIWWCSTGENIGTEFCGKNNLYERPVLIMKVYNVDTIKILPLTSKIKNGKYFVEVKNDKVISFGSLSQVKTISTKRLSRKVGRISKDNFRIVLQKYVEILTQSYVASLN